MKSVTDFSSEIVGIVLSQPQDCRWNTECIVANKLAQFLAQRLFYSPCAEPIPIPILNVNAVTELPSALPSCADQPCQHQPS